MCLELLRWIHPKQLIKPPNILPNQNLNRIFVLWVILIFIQTSLRFIYRLHRKPIETFAESPFQIIKCNVVSYQPSRHNFTLFVVELEVSKMLISKLNTIGDEDLWDEKNLGMNRKIAQY